MCGLMKLDYVFLIENIVDFVFNEVKVVYRTVFLEMCVLFER